MRFRPAFARQLGLYLLLGLLLWGWVAPLFPASAQEGDTPTPTPAAAPRPAPDAAHVSNDQETAALAQEILAHMSVPQRVGQLFLVTFKGNDVGPNSDVAQLIRDWHVGGVVLTPENENFRNEGNTAEAVTQLTNDLQTFAFRDLNTGAVGEDGKLNPSLADGIPGLPLLIAINQEGDGYPFTSLNNGFTPIPNNLALGATWQPDLARQVGAVVGQELAATGINLLLGPSLDVLDNPRPELKGYPGTRTFGGDAYWVAQMGKSYIAGVHQGSAGSVATVAKHFPGQGASDRRPDREVATVQKPLSALQQVELVPFQAVTEVPDTSDETTDAMMTSHVRYKGFQENPRQLTPPISLAPELQTIMGQFKNWRANGGLLVADSLGVGALKRYYQAYEPDSFPSRRVAQEAFLAGNDLLILAEFDKDGNWPEQVKNMQDAMSYFEQKYEEDPAFRTRVDESVTRILHLKLRLNPRLSWAATQRPKDDLSERLNKGNDLVTQVARNSITLIYPGATELADRLPSAPLKTDRILVFTDERTVTECPACQAAQSIPVGALAQIMLRLYGPQASDQLDENSVNSIGFAELDTFLHQNSDPASVPPDKQLTPERVQQINDLIDRANWIIFALQDVDTEVAPSSGALRRFLDQRADNLRDKNLIVFSFNAPYFLSDTEIGKLTAYYGLYSKLGPFLETAVRTLFRELAPAGHLPVSVTGVDYNLGRQLEPDPSQRFPLALLTQSGTGPAPVGDAGSGRIDIAVGDNIELRAGPIRDHNHNVVPDGTQAEFRFQDLQEGIELPRQQAVTNKGMASALLKIERAGSLQLSATAGEGASSDVLLLTVGGETGALLSTATATPAPTQTPTPEATPTPSPTPTATPTPPPPPATDDGSIRPATEKGLLGAGRRVTLVSFLLALMGSAAAAALYGYTYNNRHEREALLRGLLLSIIGSQMLYLLYAVGWLPGGAALNGLLSEGAAAVIAFAGGLLPFLADRLRPELVAAE